MSEEVTPKEVPEPEPKEPEVTPEPKEDPKTEKTFTQDEVKRISAREKKQGAETAATKLAEELGMSVEDAKAVIAEHQKREEDQKTELQKLTEERDAVKAEREKEVADAKRESHIERVKNRLLRPGLLPTDTAASDEALNRLVGLIQSEVGASAEDIDSDIEALKAQFPQVFADTPKVNPTPPPSGTPSGTPRKQTSGETRSERAARIAAVENQKRGIKTPTA